MKNLIAILLLMTGAALAQTTDKCREVPDSETICVFADGSATVVWHPEGRYESTHYTVAQWAKSGPAIEATASARQEQQHKHDAAQMEQWRKESEEDDKKIAAYEEQSRKSVKESEESLAKARAHADEGIRASKITNKKTCKAAGFTWNYGCGLPEGK